MLAGVQFSLSFYLRKTTFALIAKFCFLLIITITIDVIYVLFLLENDRNDLITDGANFTFCGAIFFFNFDTVETKIVVTRAQASVVSPLFYRVNIFAANLTE
jgi:hypothetical protein